MPLAVLVARRLREAVAPLPHPQHVLGQAGVALDGADVEEASGACMGRSLLSWTKPFDNRPSLLVLYGLDATMSRTIRAQNPGLPFPPHAPWTLLRAGLAALGLGSPAVRPCASRVPAAAAAHLQPAADRRGAVAVPATRARCCWWSTRRATAATRAVRRSRGAVPQVQGSRARGRRISVQRLRRTGAGQQQADRRVLPHDLRRRSSRCTRRRSVAELARNPLYPSLARATGQAPKWNFHKYVVDRNGKPVASFVSDVEPEARELTRLDRAPARRSRREPPLGTR